MANELKLFDEAIQKKLDSMVQNVRDPRAYLNRYVYPLYQQHQRKRWMTENTSEGSQWKALNPIYREYKKRIFGGGPRYKWIGGRGENHPWIEIGNWPSYPGGGQLKLIATNKLFKGVIGPSSDHVKIVYERSIFIGTSVSYAHDVNQERPFFDFAPAFKQDIAKNYAKYVLKGF